jgi:hypothetical protein
MLKAYNIVLYHFAPNVVIKICAFSWAMKLVGLDPSVVAFYKLHSLYFPPSGGLYESKKRKLVPSIALASSTFMEF